LSSSEAPNASTSTGAVAALVLLPAAGSSVQRTLHVWWLASTSSTLSTSACQPTAAAALVTCVEKL
jgi:hypothetical protein